MASLRGPRSSGFLYLDNTKMIIEILKTNNTTLHAIQYVDLFCVQNESNSRSIRLNLI